MSASMARDSDRRKEQRPDPEKELAYLKDFQRRTVDYIVKRLYGDDPPARRFLVADEVGLGKTHVARGVALHAINRLWDKVERIDIIYLCSNSDIARQNVARLQFDGAAHIPESPRITLLPLASSGLRGHRVNIIPLTPGTSLKVRGSLGLKKERALLLHLLKDHWDLEHIGACRLFAGNAGLQRFKAYVRDFTDEHTIDTALKDAFLASLDQLCIEEAAQGKKTLRSRVRTLVSHLRTEPRRGDPWKARQREIIGELRQRLGRSCIDSLEPDLIILDEFQRFKDLLDETSDDPAAEMARQLFQYEDDASKARVLLLSATPYKMYTTPDEAGGESHYDDFVATARFLLHERPGDATELRVLLKAYRAELFRADERAFERLEMIRAGLERILQSVMVRTERLAVTPDRNGMLTEPPLIGLQLEARDVVSYGEHQRLARFAGSKDTLDFWKAAPWLLNFMEDYEFARDFRSRHETDPASTELRALVGASGSALLDARDVTAFRRLDPAHGRLRWLMQHTLDTELWRMLWLPPTLPYYRLGEPFESIAEQSPGKTLLFSAWRVVPRVVAAALSHEAERRLYESTEGADADLTTAPERLAGLLGISKRDGGVAGLSALTMMYPSSVLASEFDPLRLSAELSGREPTALPALADLLSAIEGRLQPMIDRMTRVRADRAAPDESWYWAAPILLDLENDPAETRAWIDKGLGEEWSGESAKSRARRRVDDEDEDDLDAAPSLDDQSALGELVSRIRDLANGKLPSGTPPKDLTRAVALMALGGAGTAALRSLMRVSTWSASPSQVLRSAAARVGAGFRTFFNHPDSTAAVRSTTERADYWRQCLEYSAAAGMQPMLDEYVHLLASETGHQSDDPEVAASSAANRLASVTGIRRARVGASDIRVSGNRVKYESIYVRSRFAMRFGEERASDSGDNLRADDVRHAFNSPFSPFVLATTSVGQEGLDFHYYCHSVVHWNLPANPVDLEQREGRVHRFKGLAVRKNVAKMNARAWRQLNGEQDPWRLAFAAALADRAEGESDLVPFWVYPIEGGARIERHVPTYPLSRGVERFEALKDALAIYRMVFGQPRQEELLAYLVRMVPADQVKKLVERLQISLAPRPL